MCVCVCVCVCVCAHVFACVCAVHVSDCTADFSEVLTVRFFFDCAFVKVALHSDISVAICYHTNRYKNTHTQEIRNSHIAVTYSTVGGHQT